MVVSGSSGRRQPTRSSLPSRGGKSHGRFDPLSKPRDLVRDARDVSMRDVRPPTTARPSSFVQLRVSGVAKSRANSDKDHGLSALTKFLERRATIAQNKHANSKGIAKRKPVHLHKVRPPS
jgi:hypothetical protein